MSDKTQIKLIQANTIEAIENETNIWLSSMGFMNMTLNVSVFPMMVEGNVVYLAVVVYNSSNVPTYNNDRGY